MWVGERTSPTCSVTDGLGPCRQTQIHSREGATIVPGSSAPPAALRGNGLMKIAIATTNTDPRDPRSWSGTPFSVWSALRARSDVDVTLLGPLRPPLRTIEAVRKAWWQAQGQRYLWEREPRILTHYRSTNADLLARSRPDVVLALGTVPAAALPPGTPYVVYVDTTFELNVDYYETMTSVCARSRRLGEEVDQVAFQRARHVVATCEWAAESITGHYGVPPERVSVIPIGAQHTWPGSTADLAALVPARLEQPVRLTWIGVEWERKGGDIAVEVASELHRRGVPVELHLAGLTPPSSVSSLPYVRSHGFIDARTRFDDLVTLFVSSFALLLPSRAENSSVVLADAASFALPSLASDTGGMRTMVEDDVNGRVLPLDATPADYADVITTWWSQPATYLGLAARSRRRFEAELNWTNAGETLVELLSLAAVRT